MKSFERTRKVYILDRAAVDMLSEEIQEFLEGIRLEKRNRIRIRFAMEDLLLRVCEHYKESVPCTLELGRRIGVGLVVMGESARQLRGVLTQSNSLVTFLMESVSRYSPLFIALTVVSHIWSSRLSEFYDMWKPVAVYLVLVVGMWLSMLFFTAKKYHVPWKWLLQKLKPAMIISLQTASAGASYGEAENALTHRFGVPKRLTDFALPIGQTMYMPATICAFIATAYFLTETYHVQVDLTWFIVAAVVCAMLQMELIHSADSLGILNRKILEKQK